MKHVSARPRLGMRIAFTLMEVVLALGLTAVVLAAVFGAMVLYGRTTDAGRADAEKTRLAQSILRSIERDLRSIVFRKPETQTIDPMTGQAAASSTAAGPSSGTSASVPSTQSSPSTSGGGTGGFSGASGSGSQGLASQSSGGSSSASDSVVGSSTVDTTSAAFNGATGLVGDSTSLVIQISRPSREIRYQPAGAAIAAGPSTGDRQSVSWFLAVANGEGLKGMVGNLASGGSALRASESGIQGLARLSGDSMSMTLADSQGDNRSMAEAAEIVAAEVNFLEFRYFDGAAWLTEWDSAAYGALPRAVEIVIGFKPDSKVETAESAAQARLGIEESGDFHRLVVALPLAQGEPAGAF